MIVFVIVFLAVTVIFVVAASAEGKKEQEYIELETEVLRKLGFSNWNIIPYFDEYVIVNSHQAVEKYDSTKFFKDHREKLAVAKKVINEKNKKINVLKSFLSDNEYKTHPQYSKISEKINSVISNASGYRICVRYTSPTGKTTVNRTIVLYINEITKFENNPVLLMSKGEYNKYLKEQQQELLTKKHHEYYERVNEIIDYANENREKLFIKGSSERLDSLVAQLFDRTVNSIKKIKSIDSEEWGVIGNLINQIDGEIRKTVMDNQKILDYYNSDDFYKIKETCEVLMSTQREFNEYITEKVESISRLFGTRVVRNETVNDDEYQYIRPYKKAITPFNAEVSSNVFASAENSPLNYVVKYFYTNKTMYPEQIQKLHLLVEELATLKEAKKIIENYKEEYQKYLCNVPSYIIDQDEAGFYSRLGFANVDESVLVVEYKFSYTSGGGMAKRTFTIPMTEENIIELIRLLEGKLTASAFTKEQRALMTNKLRESIKKRDNFTCCNCKNSIYTEPNLLLEIDHIIPVSKGGYTVEDNLQTLCWKCNRVKSNKMS
ncbi:MAG: HNH endonuclease [Clostridia bacterium]|nr:HNH endonuclease [Clostridia bacterium]